MSSRPVVVPVKGHPGLRVSTRSGRVSITAEERSDVLIEEGAPPEDEIEIDASGQVTATTFAYVPGTVPLLSRAYFVVPLKHPGASYRLRITMYEWRDGG